MQVGAVYLPDVALSMVNQGKQLDLHSAAALGKRIRACNPDSLEQLVEGFSPLGLAVYRGHVKTAADLIDCGDDPNRNQLRAGFYMWETDAIEKGYAKWQPIHIAAVHGYKEHAADMIEVLVESGANLDGACTLGSQPIHLAAQHDWCDSIRALLELGSSVDARTQEISCVVHKLTGTPAHIQNACEQTPLMIAVSEGFENATKLLLSADADLRATDSNGSTALHLAARPWWQEQASVVAALLEAGADKTARDNQNQTPLHIAEAANHFTTVGLLS